MRIEFQMTPEDHAKILAASSTQESTNNAWEELATRLKFQIFTVKPIPGKDQRFFTAESL